MVRRLDMHKRQGIEHLYATGMSKRKIAKTFGVNRKSVDRHLAGIHSKGASMDQAHTGEALTVSQIQKWPTRPPGLSRPISRISCR
jgi:DNA-binding CsgD family transcriptional regulator